MDEMRKQEPAAPEDKKKRTAFLVSLIIKIVIAAAVTVLWMLYSTNMFFSGIDFSIVLIFTAEMFFLFGLEYLYLSMKNRSRDWSKALVMIIICFVILPFAGREYEEVQARRQKWNTILGVKTQQASMATALEAFYVDHGSYPGFQLCSDGHPTFETIFAPGGGQPLLTTPIDYISSFLSDSYSFYGRAASHALSYEDMLYAYKSDPQGGWIMGSRGPDGDWDIDYIKAYDLGKKAGAFPADPLYLVPWTYDPTNGLESSGDIWRVKQ